MLILVLADSMMKVGPKEIDGKNSRPDLIHFSLLLAHDSGLAEEKEIRTIVHTAENKIFRFEAEVDIPNRLEDFEDLIVKTVQGQERPGIYFEEKTLMEALNEEIGHRIVMSPKGQRTDPTELFSRAEDYIVIIGGFPKGDFVSPVYDWAEKTVSISNGMKKSWTVTAENLVGYRYCSLE